MHTINSSSYVLTLLTVISNIPNLKLPSSSSSSFVSIYVDSHVINGYVEEEQPNTLFDLRERVNSKMNEVTNDIEIEFDAREFNPKEFNYLANISEILANDEELEVGEFELGIFTIKVNKIKTYEEELIKCERS